MTLLTLYTNEESIDYRYHRTRRFRFLPNFFWVKDMTYTAPSAVRQWIIENASLDLEGHPNFHLHYADLGDSMSILQVVRR